MIVGVAVIELHVPHARSLKDKRRAIKSMIDRLHKRYRISIAETDLHDLHQRAELGLAVVGSGEGEIEHKLEELRRVVEEDYEVQLTNWSTDLIEGGM